MPKSLATAVALFPEVLTSSNALRFSSAGYDLRCSPMFSPSCSLGEA
jgi:hypothetical protein